VKKQSPYFLWTLVFSPENRVHKVRTLFLAALSSSRSLVVGPSVRLLVGPSVGWLVRPSVGPSVRRSVRNVCEKVTL